METVAPHAGAWIETVQLAQLRVLSRPSHPTRVRGLKLDMEIELYSSKQSHPTRVRGLKLTPNYAGGLYDRVAPHAGAWIETSFPNVVVTPIS